jgi:hypothetical protein
VIQALVLIVWWFSQVWSEAPWGQYGWANMAVQWSIALGFFVALNGLMVRQTRPEQERGEPGEVSAPVTR